MERVLGIGQPPTSPVPVKAEGRTLPGDTELRSLIKQVLTSLARQGSMVIVSHAASFALSGPDVLRVFITGSPESRARRLAAERGLNARDATRQIEQEDRNRADYLRRFYDVRSELPTHYDLVVSTDVLAPERAGEVIVAACG